MGLLSKLLGSKGVTDRGVPIAFPAILDVVPGKLSVKVFSHTTENVGGAVWSFVTDGLTTHGQREIVMTILQRKDEHETAFPPVILTFFRMVFEFAQRGQLVHPGDWSELGSSGFLAPHIRGIAYMEAQQLEGVDIPPDALVGIPLSEVEIRVAKTCGVCRVLSRRGQATTMYPFPCWYDRDQQDLVSEGADDVSMLQKVARITIKGVSLLSENNIVKMRAHPSAAKTLKEVLEQIPPDVGLAFLTEPAREADGWLVWLPGQEGPAAITPPGSKGSRLTGFHLVIAPGVEEESVRIGEDGFWLLMRTESWQRLEQALREQDCFEMRPDGEHMGFELSWLETEYKNPVDGKIISTPEGWTEYFPVGGAVDTHMQIRLLVSEHEMTQAIDVERFAAYLQDITGVVEDTIYKETGRQRTVYLQFELAPECEMVVKAACDPTGTVSESVVNRLTELSAPDVQGMLAFQVVVKI